jgi:hypothetical protein
MIDTTTPTREIHRLLSHALMATDSPTDDDDFVTIALTSFVLEGDAAFEDLSPHDIKALRDHILKIVDLRVLQDCDVIAEWLIGKNTT